MSYIKYTYQLIILTALLLAGTTILAQETGTYLKEDIEHREFDKDRWEKTVDGMNFGDEELKEEKEEKEAKPIVTPSTFFGDGRLVRILFYSIFILFFAILIVRLLSSRFTIIQTKLKPKKDYTIEDVEDHLHESDLERFLRESLEKGNFRQAIRLYYLIIIKELSQKSWINWKRDKTNFDYLKEMREKTQFPTFRKITRIFDKVWYGETDVDEPDYNRLKSYFENFLKAIRS